MSLNVLVACPSDTKFFVDLAASCDLAKKHHPEFQVDVLVDRQHIPAWWTNPARWMRTINAVSEAKPSYDLIIQVHPDPMLATDLAQLETKHRSGVVSSAGIMVQGRWAQTMLAHFGTRRFGPFAPHDLFNNVLLGRNPPQIAAPRPAGRRDWIVDVDSLPPTWKAWGEELLSNVNFAHPHQTRMEVNLPVNPATIEAYVGSDAALATWLAYHQVPVILLHEGEFDPRNIVAGPQAFYVGLTPALSVGQLMSLLREGRHQVANCRSYTDEYLGGLCANPPVGRYESVADVFDQLNYVVFNYLNDLREVDLPIPDVSAAVCMHLKGSQSVMSKLVHLNQFGMRFLNEFLAKVADGTVADKDMQELTQRVEEIDTLTEKTLAAYAELDLYRLSLRFAKASVQGNNVVEISKSLILVHHESNQALLAYAELMEAIVKKHTQAQDRPGAE